MHNIHLVNPSPALKEALEAYKQHLRLAFSWLPFQKNQVVDDTSADYFLVHNKEPEKLDGIQLMQSLRGQPIYCAIPILFVSEPISDDAKVLFNDLEFIWTFPLPFDSANFFKLINEMNKYIDANRDLLGKRWQIQEALAANRFADAKEMLLTLDKNYQSTFKFHLLLGQACFGLAEYDEALEHVNRSLKQHDKSLEANTLKASIYLRKGDQAASQAVINSMSQVAEIYLQNMIHWGDVYMERGDADKSVTAFEAALEKDPARVRAKEGLLAANLISGKTAMVRDKMSESGHAMEIELARLCNLKGIGMAKQGQFKVAEKLYTNAIKFLPKDGKIAYKLWLNLGLCMKKKGDYKEALQYFMKCKEIAPADYDRIDPQIQFVQKRIQEAEGGGSSTGGDLDLEIE